jgi:hypothetical protein
MKRYKVLGKGGIACNGGSGKWNLPQNGKPGKWMPKIEKVIPCESGYHLCREEDLILWLNEEIYEAEGRGEFIRHDNNKDVFGEARLIRKLEGWNKKSKRLFAADCAERVLPIFEKEYPTDSRPRKAIEASRKFANRKITMKNMTIAGDAAGAAGDAAWAARNAAWGAGDAAGAARDAAWAARNAAWGAGDAAGAARDAARDAAGAARNARNAAWDAEKIGQMDRLFHYLDKGKRGVRK